MKINGVDARSMGIMMGDGFLDALDLPAPLKDYVTNDSALRHGKQVLPITPKIADRDVTLTFNIEGATVEEFNARKKAFISILQAGDLKIEVLGVMYNFKYIRAQSYAMNRQRTFCSMAVKLNEPNPSDGGRV